MTERPEWLDSLEARLDRIEQRIDRISGNVTLGYLEQQVRIIADLAELKESVIVAMNRLAARVTTLEGKS